MMVASRLLALSRLIVEVRFIHALPKVVGSTFEPYMFKF